MNKYFNKPFPFVESKRDRILVSFLFSLFIFVFILIFQPFGIFNIQNFKILYILGYFGITFSVLLLSFFVAPLLFKTFFNFDNWTIGKNVIFIALQFLVITVLNWIYNITIGDGIAQQHTLHYFLLITISVGIFPTFLLLYFIEKTLSRRNQNIATVLSQDISQRTNNQKDLIIKLSSNINDETVSIKLEQLLCVKSEGNYIKVFFKEENKAKSKLLRNSIKNIEEQLSIYENVVRCHRSYIVNLDNVEKLSGNARNFILHITNLDFLIPVSRSFPKEVFRKYNL